MWHLYLVRCNDGSLYTGISTDVKRRFNAHQQNRGARRLRGRGPLELVYSHAIGNRAHALRVEYRVKKLSKAEKESLVRGDAGLPDWADRPRESAQAESDRPSRKVRVRSASNPGV